MTVAVCLSTALIGVGGANWNSDFELFEAAHDSTFPTITVEVEREAIPGSSWWNRRNYVGHVATSSNPYRDFVVAPPVGGCGQNLSVPLLSAAAAGLRCTVVTNAGFFDPVAAPHACLGAAFRRGHQLFPSTTAKVATFATMGRNSVQSTLVVGYPNATTLLDLPLQSLITGQGWIVRNGRSNVANALKDENWTLQRSGSARFFADLQAPRLSLGHDGEGRLMLVAIDGDESLGEGVSLWDFADILISMGLWNAINLDGGGSVSFAVDGVVTNVPSDTCESKTGRGKVRCTRKVATAVCLGYNAVTSQQTVSPTATVRSDTKSKSSSTSPSVSNSITRTTTPWSPGLQGWAFTFVSVVAICAFTIVRWRRAGMARVVYSGLYSSRPFLAPFPGGF